MRNSAAFATVPARSDMNAQIPNACDMIMFMFRYKLGNAHIDHHLRRLRPMTMHLSKSWSQKLQHCFDSCNPASVATAPACW